MEIEQKISQLMEILQAQRNNLTRKLEQLRQEKKRNLSQQKNDLQATQSELDGCVSSINDRFNTSSKREFLKIVKVITEQVEAIQDEEFSRATLSPCEHADVKFRANAM